jgi:hypothetical protein
MTTSSIDHVCLVTAVTFWLILLGFLFISFWFENILVECSDPELGLT